MILSDNSNNRYRGSGLIGTAILKDLKNKGAKVYNADINVATDLENGLISCDITSDKSIAMWLMLFSTAWRIDGLVNNAYPRTEDWGNKFEDIDPASWRKNVDMQLNSLFVFCQETLKIMKDQKSGSIVNMGSIYGVVGNDFTVYEKYRPHFPGGLFCH